MTNKLDKVKDYAQKNKGSVLLFALLILGVFLLVFSSASAPETEAQENTQSLEEYKARLEEELSAVCSSVSGVGRCKVTVTFERGEEKIYKGSSVIETRPPKVLGVTVVCKGADSDKVRSEIIDMMSALFDIGTNRIAVLKLN